MVGLRIALFIRMTLSQHVQPHRPPAPMGIILSLIIVGLGGFVGGLLIEHGPTYFNLHVTQPVLGFETGISDFASGPTSELVSAPVSELIPDPPTEPALQTVPKVAPTAVGAEARIVIHAGKRTYLVLQDGASKDWGTGPIKTTIDDYLTTLRQSTKATALDPGQRAWHGAKVTLYDAKGHVCNGIVESIDLLEQFAGDSMTEGGWDEHRKDGPALVARITSTQANCKGATWARHADLPAPSLGRIRKGTRSTRKEARKAFRSSIAYRKIQEQHEDAGLAGKWDAFWKQPLTIRVVQSAGQELVFVQAQVGGCGDFRAQLGTLFVRQTDGTLKAMPSDNNLLADIEAAADIDGDGDLDLITLGDGYDRSLMLQNDSEFSQMVHVHVGLYYCRC